MLYGGSLPYVVERNPDGCGHCGESSCAGDCRQCSVCLTALPEDLDADVCSDDCRDEAAS